MSDSLLSLNQSSNNTSTKSGAIEQVIYGIVLVILLYMIFIFIEVIYNYINRLSLQRTILLPHTYVTDDKSKIIIQNPNIPQSKSVHLSQNERSGIEFSYSFYLNVHPSTFRQEEGLLHIFHKGYSTQFPLLAPGVYMKSETNTLRVYMNTYKTWNNYLDVEDIPVSKWVHLVIVCKNNSLEIYVNGNLKKKLPFDGFTPYQNFQDICCFNQRRISLNNAIITSLGDKKFDVFGAMKGLLSRLNYFSYALCYAEIQDLMNEGPSSKIDSDAFKEIPPYFADTWWAQSY